MFVRANVIETVVNFQKQFLFQSKHHTGCDVNIVLRSTV